jgi:hypothetical protein
MDGQELETSRGRFTATSKAMIILSFPILLHLPRLSTSMQAVNEPASLEAGQVIHFKLEDHSKEQYEYSSSR